MPPEEHQGRAWRAQVRQLWFSARIQPCWSGAPAQRLWLKLLRRRHELQQHAITLSYAEADASAMPEVPILA